MQKQHVVAGCNLGGSGTDLAANMSLIHNLMSHDTEALHLLLVNQHFFLPALVIQGGLKNKTPIILYWPNV